VKLLWLEAAGKRNSAWNFYWREESKYCRETVGIRQLQKKGVFGLVYQTTQQFALVY
jgi:hypothetical protein